jgi:hypothetical protein
MRKNPTGRKADDFPAFSNAREFEALSDADKEKVSRYYDEGRHLGETRPLTAGERAEVRQMQAKAQKRMGRPKVGKGAKVIALSIERDIRESRACGQVPLHSRINKTACKHAG